VLTATLLVVTIWAGPTEDLRAEARRIADREGLQTSLGYDAQQSAARPATSSVPLPPRRRDREPPPEDEPRDRPDLPSTHGAAWARTLLIVIGIAALVAIVAAILARWRGGARADTQGGAAPAPPGTQTPLPKAALGPAEALAAEGRYDEAVHRLLLDALALLAAGLPEPLPEHLTSREVLARLPLAPAPRAALADLVDAVEVSLFGGRALGADAWHAAHDAYLRLSRGSAAA
jgi:hypothetical protein